MDENEFDISSELRHLHSFLIRIACWYQHTKGWYDAYDSDKYEPPRTLWIAPDFSKASYNYSWAYGCIDINFYGEYFGFNRDARSYRLKIREQGLGKFIDFSPVDEMIQLVFNGINSPKWHLVTCNNRFCASIGKDRHITQKYGNGYLCEECLSLVIEDVPLSIPSYWSQNQKDKAKEERAKMSKSLRFQILERDGFCCKACGRDPRKDKIKLHVDHVIPIAKGGMTEVDNLQTLCSDCNLAKSDSIIPEMNKWKSA